MDNTLESLRVYNEARRVGKMVFMIYSELPKEYRYSTGRQLLSAADSIGANISEGYGRYHYRDQIRFLHIARGSLQETRHWILVCQEREWVSEDRCSQLLSQMKNLSIQLNNYISYLRKKDKGY